MVITAAIEIFGSPFFGSASQQHCQGSRRDRDPLDREPDGHIHGVRAASHRHGEDRDYRRVRPRKLPLHYLAPPVHLHTLHTGP